MTTKNVLVEVEVPENWPTDRIVGVDPCVLAVKHLGAFPSRLVPPARAVEGYRAAAWKEAIGEKVEEAVSVGDGVTAALWQGHLNALSALLSHPAEPARAVGDDTAILDWLEQHCVNVRVPARYGSRDLFWASPIDVDDQHPLPSELRSKVRALLAAAPAEAKPTPEQLTHAREAMAYENRRMVPARQEPSAEKGESV